MKKFFISALIAVITVGITGCNSDNNVSDTQSETSVQSEPVVSDTDSADAEFRSAIKGFTRPAFSFVVEEDTPEPYIENVVLQYDEQGRIKQCDYLSLEGMKCKAYYTYNDTYAHIFTFCGDYLVDDLVIHCEYNQENDWTVIDGYYFKNTISTENSDK